MPVFLVQIEPEIRIQFHADIGNPGAGATRNYVPVLDHMGSPARLVVESAVSNDITVDDDGTPRVLLANGMALDVDDDGVPRSLPILTP